MKHRQHGQHIADHLEISEIFCSLQGEGPFLGQPATFVRLSGCLPPFCPWCDTIHAQQGGHSRKITEIIQTCHNNGKKLIVITGGEPFLQWEPELLALENELLRNGHTVQYETSGKVKISSLTKGFIVCSPKYLQSKWHFLAENLTRVSAFKFVVDDGYDHIETFIDDHKIGHEKVWLMSQGSTRSEQIKRSIALWEYCINQNFNFSPRLHVLVHDDKKGV